MIASLCVAFVFACISTCVHAQSAPQPCVTPSQWEGTAWFIDNESGEMTIVVTSYDDENKRISAISTTLNSPTREVFQFIFDWSRQLFYTIDMTTSSCFVRFQIPSLISSWPVFLHANASFQYRFMTGTGRNSLLINSFALEYNESSLYKSPYSWLHGMFNPSPCHPEPLNHAGHVHTWYGTFTDADCVPVMETIYEGDLLHDDLAPAKIIYSIRYENITAGLSDPSVFKPPQFCPGVHAETANKDKKPIPNGESKDGAFKFL